MTTPLSDITNMQMEVVEPKEERYDVAVGYALLAGAPLPPLKRGDDLEA